MEQYVKVVEEWLSNRALGTTIMEAIQASLTHVGKGAPPVDDQLLKQLHSMAPSSSLYCHLRGQGESSGDSASIPFELQDNYVLLQGCAKRAIKLKNTITTMAIQAVLQQKHSDQNQEEEDINGGFLDMLDLDDLELPGGLATGNDSEGDQAVFEMEARAGGGIATPNTPASKRTRTPDLGGIETGVSVATAAVTTSEAAKAAAEATAAEAEATAAAGGSSATTAAETGTAEATAATGTAAGGGTSTAAAGGSSAAATAAEVAGGSSAAATAAEAAGGSSATAEAVEAAEAAEATGATETAAGGASSVDVAAESALLALSLCQSITTETQLMVLVAGTLSLETPEDELYSYFFMWKLAPYMNDDSLVALKELTSS